MEANKDDSHRLKVEEALHEQRREAVDDDAGEPPQDAQPHGREKKAVHCPLGVDLLCVSQGEDAETQLEASQEPVLTQNVVRPSCSKLADLLVHQEWEVQPSSEDALGACGDDGQHVGIEKEQGQGPQKSLHLPGTLATAQVARTLLPPNQSA